MLLWILAILLTTSCTVKHPKLNRPFLPQGYAIDATIWSDIIEIPQPLYLIELNDRYQLNQQVLSFWKRGLLSELFLRAQPLSTVHSEDVVNLASFLNHQFIIYLAAIVPKKPFSQQQFQQAMRRRYHCDPLTNLEIRFLMNSGTDTPFSRKPLTMLLITSHELSLQSGAKPLYPKVFSPYLRTRYQLPPLNPLEDINLFATKNENRVYLSPMNGFIVCNRRYKNNPSK